MKDEYLCKPCFTTVICVPGSVSNIGRSPRSEGSLILTSPVCPRAAVDEVTPSRLRSQIEHRTVTVTKYTDSSLFERFAGSASEQPEFQSYTVTPFPRFIRYVPDIYSTGCLKKILGRKFLGTPRFWLLCGFAGSTAPRSNVVDCVIVGGDVYKDSKNLSHGIGRKMIVITADAD